MEIMETWSPKDAKVSKIPVRKTQGNVPRDIYQFLYYLQYRNIKHNMQSTSNARFSFFHLQTVNEKLCSFIFMFNSILYDQ